MNHADTKVNRVPDYSRKSTYVMDRTVEEFYPREFSSSTASEQADGFFCQNEFKEAIENIKKQYLTGKFQDFGSIEDQIVECINDFDGSHSFKKFQSKKHADRHTVNGSLDSSICEELEKEERTNFMDELREDVMDKT